MPLILAVEPNATQAQQLATLVRQHLRGAELVTAPSATAALQMLGDRIPDLILTPALLAPKDESAITERLRELGTAAAHTQTLAVPILAAGPAPAARRIASGLLGGLKRDKGEPEEPVGCDPKVFAEQIHIYLERAAQQRQAAPAGEVPAPAAEPPLESPAAEEDEPLDVIFDLPADALPPPLAPRREDAVSRVIDVPPPLANASFEDDLLHTRTAAIERLAESGPPEPAAPASGAARGDVWDQHHPAPADTRVTRAMEAELGLTTPSASVPLWRVTEGVEDFYKGTADFAPDATAAPPSPAEPAPREEAMIAAAPPAHQPPAAIEPELRQPADPVSDPAGDEESEEGTFVEVDLTDMLSAAGAARQAPPDDVFVVSMDTVADDPVTAPPVAVPSVVAPPAAPPVAAPAAAAAAPAAEPPRQKASRRAKKAPPQPLEDWAYFEPSQAPFKALVRRLDEIAGRPAAQ